MRRNSALLMLVILLLGVVLLREPRLAQAEDQFLGWLLRHSQAPEIGAVPLTVVDIAQESFRDPQGVESATDRHTRGVAASPLEFALFLQSVLDFQPNVVAFENVLRWRDRDKDQEQIFLDQAMRVPKLLLACELGPVEDPDAPWGDIRGFPNVVGKRGDLAVFSGVVRQPNEDLRLVSTAGFVNLPEEVTSSIRVPLLFLYRGEVIPSFPLQAFLTWLRITPGEVQVVLGSHILLPQDRRIPIGEDGTLLIDPNAAKRAQRIGLNELLLAAQQHESGTPDPRFANLHDHLVLARTPDNPRSPPDIFAAAIATMQGNKFVRRISRLFDCVLVLCVAASVGIVRKLDRFDIVLLGIAFTAAYCLIALGMISRWGLWLPGILPLTAVWVSVLVAFFLRERPQAAAAVEVPPPIP